MEISLPRISKTLFTLFCFFNMAIREVDRKHRARLNLMAIGFPKNGLPMFHIILPMAVMACCTFPVV
ncbi:hypothetical protein OOZ15_19785 [Galbibacter sp. EGI 63066]|uniref:hypothetical protein n=1 Tax=Galbibacter sp. EGI 63066 TaxID=2993559 RepID=UPI002248D5BA|nr:hypothetical protein [Galbibacter sp. EGI 63066]MCX2682192.1 hypothetical protein [Galbibacter sp. EGI 63066]